MTLGVASWACQWVDAPVVVVIENVCAVRCGFYGWIRASIFSSLLQVHCQPTGAVMVANVVVDRPLLWFNCD